MHTYIVVVQQRYRWEDTKQAKPEHLLIHTCIYLSTLERSKRGNLKIILILYILLLVLIPSSSFDSSLNSRVVV